MTSAHPMSRGGERCSRVWYGESGAVFPSVSGLPALRSPLLGPAPAAAHFPTLPRAGGSGSGEWPDHSDCIWDSGLGKQGWEAEAQRSNNRAEGGGMGERGGDADRGGEKMHHQCPSLAHTEEHKSALSVYDNLYDGVTPDNLAARLGSGFLGYFRDLSYEGQDIQLQLEGDSVSRDTSLWSSCEIILEDSGSSNGPAQEQHTGAEMEPRQLPTTPLQTHVVASLAYSSQTGLQAQRHPAVADHSPGEVPPHGTRVPPPLPLADPSASALRSLLTRLQQQIGQQRDKYEERISSLEQRNEEVQNQLLGLGANLAQQRRWYQVVQAKIQESEQARAAAEARNDTLQREMDQFFGAFGELNNEAQKAERIIRSF